MNKVHLSGRLGKNPELKKTPNGTSVCSCSIAIDEYRKKDESGNDEGQANWQQLQVWKQSAEFLCDNAQRGDKIFIEGRIQNDQWETNGETHFRSYVIVERLEMLPKETKGKKHDYGDGMATESIPGAKDMPAEQYERRDEDLPF